VVVGSREWPLGRPELVQESKDVPRIGSESGIEFGNRDVSHLLLLPSLFLIRLEYFIERLFQGLSSVRHHYRTTWHYLVVPSDGEGTVLQLIGRKVRQDIGNISRNIGSGGERNLLVAVVTNGHLPARDVEV
jgi:hypothetical protein